MRVLCALDRGEQAPAVARVAASLAQPLEARLLLAHVVEPHRTASADPEWHRELAAEERENLARISRDAGCDHWAQATVRIGAPGVTLEKLARRWRADFVVCGSRGRGKIRASLLGSVSTRLIQRSGRPVLAVPPRAAQRWAAGEPEDGPMSSIVCGVDGSIAAFEAAEAAAHIAAGLHARLTLVHAYQPVREIALSTPPYSVLDVDEFAKSERRNRTQVVRSAASFANERTEVRTVMIEAEPAPALERVAEEQRAGLVVVGSRGRGRLLATVLGSTSASLTASGSRPVLVVPEVHSGRLRWLDPSDRWTSSAIPAGDLPVNGANDT